MLIWEWNGKLPDWRFDKDRQHWHYARIGGSGNDWPTDAGWPVKGHIQLNLDKAGTTAISPPTLWKADDAQVVYIDAAYKAKQTRARIAWTDYSIGNAFCKFDIEKSFFTWFYRILRNLCFNFIRDCARHATPFSEIGEGAVSEISDPSQNSFREIEQNELKEIMWKAINQLKPNDREIIISR